MHRLLVIASLVFLLGIPAASAQPPNHAPPQPAPEISAAQASQVLAVLNDPKKRAEFVATLEAIVKTHPEASVPAATTATAPPAAATPAQPKAIPATPPLRANLLEDISMFFRHLSAEIMQASQTVRSAPLLWGWLKVMATDPWAQGVLADIFWRLVLALAAGLATQWAIGRVLRRPRTALARRMPNGNGHPNGDLLADEPDGEGRAERGETEPPRRRRLAAVTLLLRLPLILARLVLDLLPILGFALVAHAIADGPLGGDVLTHGVIIVVIDAYVVYAGLICIAEMLFSPSQPELRLLNVTDATAAYAMRWIQRIVLVGLIAPTVGNAGSVLGMSDSARHGLLTAGSFIDHVLVAIIVLQQRRVVAARIAAADDDHSAMGTLRNGLAAAWHWIALFIIGAAWLVASVEIQNGFTQVLYFVGETIAVLVVGRIALIVGLGLIDRLLRFGSAVSVSYPTVEARLLLYRGALQVAVRVAVFVIGAMALLQLWGLRTLAWLTNTNAGQQLLAAVLSLAVTVLLALVVWETVNAAIERHMARLASEAQLPRSARLRTLLPLLRTTLMITILTVATLMALSEIGVNTGPLLAGAGIVGVAIGFGSQKLVQDLITGIFLLLENAMQVGDWVTVSGLSGTVENLSVRTIRLRAGDGSVHIIPFSSVTSVTNVNRGLGNAAVSVSVASHEDTDRVSDILKDIVTGMRGEPDFASKMLSDFQLWGVDKVDGSCVTIVGQVVCTDSGRWNVQREFNRRMKKRFEAAGIELYNPVQRMVAVTQMTEQQTAKAMGHEQA